ncbi:hypothetical protein [Pantoea stewartii]|uniref:RipA family octameric membrane protein n=1 Tax=Pantoea stewartii TaxID=66269 RepID=UPI0016257C23|nr:hypothetical protein [Pantoea stewartii]MBC0855635.1 hypothetical protein [Pantoea stewartii]
MKIPLPDDHKAFITALLDEPVDVIEMHSPHAEHIDRAYTVALQQKNHEAEADWKRTITFLALFVFLYAALGASLTLDLSPAGASHKSIEYALEAVPVLIAFSGFFISVLYLFLVRAGSRQHRNWQRTLLILERYTTGHVFKLTHQQGAGTSNYSLSSIMLALAMFICLTWLIIYNYLTFTTSGVFGSVISLFISTIVYVILDIQLLKPWQSEAENDPSGVDENKADR